MNNSISIIKNQVGKTLYSSVRDDTNKAHVGFIKNGNRAFTTKLCTHEEVVEKFARFIGAC